MPTHAGPGARTYLIVMADDLAARDIEDTVLERDPAAQVLTARDEPAAMALLGGRPALAAAFLHATPEGFAASALGRAIRDCGGRGVLIGGAAERQGRGEGWVALRQPFFSDTVRDLLDELDARA